MVEIAGGRLCWELCALAMSSGHCDLLASWSYKEPCGGESVWVGTVSLLRGQ